MCLKSAEIRTLALQFLPIAWGWNDPQKAEELLARMEKESAGSDNGIVKSVRQVFDEMKKYPGDHSDDRVELIRQMRDLLLGPDD